MSKFFWSVLSTLSILLHLQAASAEGSTRRNPISVLVWDRYFEPSKWQSYLPAPGSGQIGDVFAWDPAYSSPRSGANKPDAHGFWVSYTLLKDLPEVVAHRLHDNFIPWQDPERCALVFDPEFYAAVKAAGAEPLVDCRSEARNRIKELNKFIAQKKIKLVNMSHGIFYDNYVDNNRRLLRDKYPGVSGLAIDRFLYKNFLALGEILEPIFKNNPEVVFVAAAGNNATAIDRVRPLWTVGKGEFKIPTWFASLSAKYDNIIVVAATYDGQRLAQDSNYGSTAVDFVKHIGAEHADSFPVPNLKGEFEPFTGTSAAAAETSRLFIRALINYGGHLVMTPQFLKKISREVSVITKRLKDKVFSGGVLREKEFFAALERARRTENERYRSAPDWTTRLKKINPLKVIAANGNFEEFSPSITNGKNDSGSCHTLAVDRGGNIWATYTRENAVLRFSPATRSSRVFQLSPIPLRKDGTFQGPDGISLAPDDQVWYGEYHQSSLGRIDPASEQTFRYTPSGPLKNLAHVAVGGPDQHVWATSHHGRKIYEFDPKTLSFVKEWNVRSEWPRDPRADRDGQVWVTAGEPVLIQLDSLSGLTYYHQLPDPIKDSTMFIDLDPSGRYLYVSLEFSGFALFDKWAKKFYQFVRTDEKSRKSRTYAITVDPQSGKVAMGNLGREGQVSIDLFDPANPTEIRSYAVPLQVGMIKEGLDFDSRGNIWYCQNATNILGKLTP